MLWHNTSTGADVIWAMNGSSVLSSSQVLGSAVWSPATALLHGG
jgi:hypothetical protein